MSLIKRQIEQVVRDMVPYFKVITITGPRQSGKTTLCKQLFPDYEYVNLEDMSVREQAAIDPKAFLSSYTSGVIIDEAQNFPELFSYLQVISDAHPDRRYIITGSSNFSLLERITQSLAGRAAVLTLLPLSLQELGDISGVSTDTLLLNGATPLFGSIYNHDICSTPTITPPMWSVMYGVSSMSPISAISKHSFACRPEGWVPSSMPLHSPMP